MPVLTIAFAQFIAPVGSKSSASHRDAVLRFDTDQQLLLVQKKETGKKLLVPVTAVLFMEAVKDEAELEALKDPPPPPAPAPKPAVDDTFRPKPVKPASKK